MNVLTSLFLSPAPCVCWANRRCVFFSIVIREIPSNLCDGVIMLSRCCGEIAICGHILWFSSPRTFRFFCSNPFSMQSVFNAFSKFNKKSGKKQCCIFRSFIPNNDGIEPSSQFWLVFDEFLLTMNPETFKFNRKNEIDFVDWDLIIF